METGREAEETEQKGNENSPQLRFHAATPTPKRIETRQQLRHTRPIGLVLQPTLLYIYLYYMYCTFHTRCVENMYATT